MQDSALYDCFLEFESMSCQLFYDAASSSDLLHILLDSS